MSREMIPRGARTDSPKKTEQKQKQDIEIKEVPTIEQSNSEEHQKTMAEKDKEKKEKHKQRSHEYYHTHREEVLKRMKDKKLKKRLQRLKDTEKNVKTEIEERDKKEDESIPIVSSHSTTEPTYTSSIPKTNTT